MSAAATLEVIGGRWPVAGALTMNTVAGVLAASVDTALPETGVIDLKDVDPVDSAGVALMLAWKRRGRAEGRALTFTNVPPGLSSLAELYAVEELLTA